MSAGVGAAVIDSIFAILAGMGLSQVSNLVEAYEGKLSFVGAVVLFGMGIAYESKRRAESKNLKQELQMDKNFLSGSGSEIGTRTFSNFSRSKSKHGLWKSFLIAVFLTATNPMTILGFAGLFVIFGVRSQDQTSQILDFSFLAPLAFGVFLGAFSWWAGLTRFVFRMRGRLSQGFVNRVHVVTHILIFISAFVCLGRAVF